MTSADPSVVSPRSEVAVSGLRYYYNGNILTMDPKNPSAGHMLVCGNRIRQIGQAALSGLDFRRSDFPAARREYSSLIEFIDLGGRTVIPGMTDSHAHFMWWAVNQSRADLSRARSESECINELKNHIAKTGAQRGEWIIGFGWSHNLWNDAKLPTRESLDTAFPDNPVTLSSKCGHLAWVNSAALAAADLDETAADPAGGEIERAGTNGRRLTGILKETATKLVDSKIADPSEQTLRAALASGQELAWSLGLTGMQTPECLNTWAFLQRAHAEDLLRMRINFWIPVAALDQLEELQVRHGLGDELLRISAVKLFTDGSLGGRTALMYDPYENEPGNLGICVTEKDELTRRTLQANRAGLAMAVHAIGDRAIDYVLSAFEASAAAGTHPPVRNRIEHLQVFSPRDLDRLRAIKPTASMQPIHLCADMGPADRYWGKRARFAYAFKTLSDAGCPLAFGSDAPVEPIHPFYGVFAAVTRQNLECEPHGGWYAEEKIPVQQALEAYTTGPAAAAGQSAILGDLSAGKLADFLVLDADPTTVPEPELKDLRPAATFADGRMVYSDGSWADAR